MADLPPDTKSEISPARDKPAPAPEGVEDDGPKPDDWFGICDGVRFAARSLSYDRRRGDPLYRPLRIYTLDPAQPKLAGSTTTVMVPYEPLRPGPIGAMFEVVDRREDRDGQCVTYPPVDLDDPRVLMRDGMDPSSTDPLFHQQMVYAVCCTVFATFRHALGRLLTWGFSENDGGPTRLKIRPHAREEKNAAYDPTTGELRFGYYKSNERAAGRNSPNGVVFTCLSHDIVAHEVTHAILDGLRPHFCHPSGPDALALHEAMGDLVALFQRFTFESVVRAAMEQSKGQIECSSLLVEVARQFGDTTTGKGPLRTAMDKDGGIGPQGKYDASYEPHQLGSVLVGAVFGAFRTIYARKAHDFVRLATRGTGVLPPGDLSPPLLDFLSREASKIASHFLNICIRAIDYCPPVDVTFGDYLRAMITADYNLVPDDPCGYREAMIDAFAERKIFPLDVPSLTEDALLWREPSLRLSPVKKLSFSALHFGGDPGRPAAESELLRQARVVGRLVTDPRYADEFGIVFEDSDRLNEGDVLDRPCVESVRSSRRVGPDGEIVFDLIATVTQKRVLASSGGPGVTMIGGSTIIIGPDGTIRYVIRKHVGSDQGMQRIRAYAQGPGQKFWDRDEKQKQRLVATSNVFSIVHAESDRFG